MAASSSGFCGRFDVHLVAGGFEDLRSVLAEIVQHQNFRMSYTPAKDPLDRRNALPDIDRRTQLFKASSIALITISISN